jgi:hypothetical protein
MRLSRVCRRACEIIQSDLTKSSPLASYSPDWNRALAYVMAVMVGALSAVFLFGIPVQLSDSFTEFSGAAGLTLRQVVESEFQGGPYLRPFRRGLVKIVFDLSRGHYYLAFRGFQAAEVLVLLILVVRMLRVRTRTEVAAVPLLLAMVVGAPTFAGAIYEGLPINHFLTILLCVAAAVNLAQARHRLAVDVVAVALFVFAALTIESGLLLWVVFVAGYAVGYRGVSREAIVALTACVVLYFVGRFVILGGEVPGLTERSTGFGFSVYDPAALIERFGRNPLPFHIYNVISAIACVLFAEPRGGVWMFIRDVSGGRAEPWQFVSVLTSTATSVVIFRYALWRWPAWRARQLDDGDRLVLLFLAILPANALFAAAYAKDVIMSPAGLLYAAAACVSFRVLVPELNRGSVGLSRATAGTLVLLLSMGWTVRFVGAYYNLRLRALSVRNEWAYYDDWENSQPIKVPLTAADLAIKRSLLEDAISRAPRAPDISIGWADRLFDPLQ